MLLVFPEDKVCFLDDEVASFASLLFLTEAVAFFRVEEVECGVLVDFLLDVLLCFVVDELCRGEDSDFLVLVVCEDVLCLELDFGLMVSAELCFEDADALLFCVEVVTCFEEVAAPALEDVVPCFDVDVLVCFEEVSTAFAASLEVVPECFEVVVDDSFVLWEDIAMVCLVE